MTTMNREEQKQVLIDTANHIINRDNTSPYSENLRELARIALASLEAEPVCVIDQSNLDYLKSGSDADVWPASRTEMGDVLLYRAAPPAPVSVPAAMEIDDDFDSAFEHGKAVGWNAYRAAMLQAEPVSKREQVRREHAEWSDKTFGDVGPVGPLKHLSKEALEAAAEPDDLSEWADMQFLLWDAQRRAGISDAEITAAMEDKLKINMERQWPEPKDGEPRLHIKEPGNSPVIPDGWVMVPKELTPEMMRAVQIRSELGGYATSNLSGAYNMFSEFWNVAVSAAPKVDDL